MNPRSGILAGGNWIVDKVKVIDTYPPQEALTNIRSQSISNGGSPFNLLVDLARLEVKMRSAGIGLIGQDAEGKWILEECARHGIDCAQLRIDATAPTSYTDVMTVRSSGRRTFFHQRGANALLGPEHFDFTESREKIFHLGYLLLLDRLDEADGQFGTAAARVLKGAHDAGLKTSVDVVSEDSERFAEVVLPALPHVDYCILNEFEIERTTGLSTRRDGGIDLPGIKAASRRLLDAGVREWVVVHFPEGAAALNPQGRFFLQGSLQVPPSEIASTVGAGDAFAAGLLYGLHEGMPMETALRYGIAVAAASLLGMGTSDGIRPLDQCLALEESWGRRILE